MTPADELARLLDDNGFTQARLARTICRSRNCVNRWVKGRAPVPVELLLWLRLVDKIRRLPTGQ